MKMLTNEGQMFTLLMLMKFRRPAQSIDIPGKYYNNATMPPKFISKFFNETINNEIFAVM